MLPTLRAFDSSWSPRLVRRADVAAALLDLDLHVELAARGEMRDHVIGIDDLDVVLRLDVARGHHAFARLLERERRFVAVVHLQHDALQVQQNVDDVFLHAVDRRVLVQHAGHLDLGRGEAGHRGEQRAAQRVAERVAVAALERLHREPGVERRDVLDVDDARLQKKCYCWPYGSIPLLVDYFE